jgi:AraC-like DNA-binding protein
MRMMGPDEQREIRMTYDIEFGEAIPHGEVIALVAAHAPREGANPSVWPGLTFYRFNGPTPLHWDAVHSLSIGVVAQGRKRVFIDGTSHAYDPFHYLVMTRGLQFQAEILQASPSKPFLSFVLQVDPAMVKEVLKVLQPQSGVRVFRGEPAPPSTPARVSPFDQNMLGSISRFLRSLDDEADRNVLAPMFLREIVYRLLHAEQCDQLVQEAMRAAPFNPVSAAIEHMRANLGLPLTVHDISDEVHMSPSAFSRLFREVTGVAHYRFLKRLRLDSARTAIVHDGRSVTEAAMEAGYSSLSHFICEFKRHYGETPGTYADRLGSTSMFTISEEKIA